MSRLDVFAPGTKVKFCDNDIKGVVIAINIESRSRYQYKVAWWNGNSRNAEWVDHYEVEKTSNDTHIKVGFIKDN